jgi:homoserine dehydrogenase
MLYLDLLLVGFGHVGRRFARLLEEKSVRLRGDYDLSWRVVGIATKRHGTAYDARGLDLVRALRLAEAGAPLGTLIGAESGRTVAPDATGLDLVRHAVAEARARRMQQLVVVETTTLDIERGQPATDHVMAALRGGAHVITANKGPVAFAYREIASANEMAHRRFLFEGAVMDGIPVFNLVRETLPAVEILGFRGIVNATTNHILTAMEDGRSFDAALAEMQAAGIAEADPSFDIDGWDAAAKTAALINVLMKGSVTPRTIDREGIRAITREQVLDAVSRGKRIRLVASADRAGGHAIGRVAPVELEASDPLSGLRGLQNQVVLHTDLLGAIGIQQLEGGLVQTAYALLSDLISIARGQGRPHASA